MIIELCVHGYHVFKGIWEATIGESLLCERRTRNTKDRYAVAMKNFACENYMVLLQPQIPYCKNFYTANLIMATVVDTV